MEPVPQSEPVVAPVAPNAVWPTSYSILKQSLSFYKKHAKAFLMLGILPFAISLVIAVLTPLLDDTSSPVIVLAALLAIILGIASGIVAIANQTAIIKSVETLENGGAVNVKEMYKLGFALFFPMLWISILSMFVVFGGFVALIVPGIILGIYIYFAYFAMILEGKRGMAALVQSMAYAKGQGMEIFKKSFYLGLVSFALYAVIAAIVAGVSIIVTGEAGTFFAAVTDRAPASFWKSAYTAISDLLMYVVFLPIYFAYSYYMFKEARAAKQSAPATDAERGSYRKTLITWSIVGVVASVVFVALYVVPLVGFTLTMSGAL